jgi:hypothetical protein
MVIVPIKIQIPRSDTLFDLFFLYGINGTLETQLITQLCFMPFNCIHLLFFFCIFVDIKNWNDLQNKLEYASTSNQLVLHYPTRK